MSKSILVIGDSGRGKSTGIESLDAESTFLINVIGKDLPFKGSKKKYQLFDKTTKKGNMVVTQDADKVVGIMESISTNYPQFKTIVIDDWQYIMSFEFMARAREKGFDKFTEIGQKGFNTLRITFGLRDDLVVFVLAHSEDLSANGFMKTKVKTIGKMLDEKITVEGLFTTVLLADAHKENKKMEYVFVTQSDGTTSAKSPRGMFKDLYIPNDLQAVRDAVIAYEE